MTPSPTLPARIMIAKPGLDGHDRGAVVVVQGLRDAGFDLIYTGLRRTPREIAVAAAQEDVDVLGLSCLSGAHLTLLKAVADELQKIDWRPTVLLAGGIIPAEDIDPIRAMGFDLVFGPGTSLNTIAESIRARTPARTQRSMARCAFAARAQRLTELELTATPAGAAGVRPRGRIAVLMGQGGVGKSTLIGGLLRSAATGPTAAKKIAVIANDPTGVNQRGAILADRLRMPMDLDPDQVLIRSLPVRAQNAEAAIGLSARVGAMAEQLAQDFDLVLVETIGVGQNQTATAATTAWADERIAVLAPGMGDHWQLRKAAILETADRVILTKNDLPTAAAFAADLEQVLHDTRPAAAPQPPIHRTAENAPATLTALLTALIG